MLGIALPDWYVDSFTVRGSEGVAFGWIMPTREGASLEVLFNGKPAQTQFSEGRPDVARAWRAAGIAPVTFVAVADISDAGDAVRMEVRCDGLVRPGNAWAQPLNERFPAPGAQRRERVHGADEEQRFLRAGFSNYLRIKQLIERYARPTETPIPILDWGCGAGSIGRYALNDSALNYTGADIDHDNIAWCRENLDRNRFVAISTEPPTAFADDSFDVIFGISVLTHLREKDQFKWLAELARIVRPRGLCLLSVLGAQAQAKMPWLDDDGHEVSRRGFQFVESAHEIGRIVGDEKYYGTAYHRKNYVVEHWSPWFDVVDYVVGALGHQDVVVARAH